VSAQPSPNLRLRQTGVLARGEQHRTQHERLTPALKSVNEFRVAGVLYKHAVKIIHHSLASR
jgi:hypothetical protein